LEGESLCGNYILGASAHCYESDLVLAGEDCALCGRILPEVRKGGVIQKAEVIE